MTSQPGNPLHGVTLEMILTDLVTHFGWSELGEQVKIRCFTTDPSIASSLKFLRRTPWAREKVESLYPTSTSSKPCPPTGESPRAETPSGRSIKSVRRRSGTRSAYSTERRLRGGAPSDQRPNWTIR